MLADWAQFGLPHILATGSSEAQIEVGSFLGESKYPNNWPRLGGSKHRCDCEPSAVAGLIQNKVSVDCSVKLFFIISPEESIGLLFVYQISIDITLTFYIHVDMEIAIF